MRCPEHFIDRLSLYVHYIDGSRQYDDESRPCWAMVAQKAFEPVSCVIGTFVTSDVRSGVGSKPQNAH